MTLTAAEHELTPHPRHEEIINTLTHGSGLLAAIVGTAAVIAANRFGTATAGTTFGLYSATLIAVYAASALSHGVRHPKVKYLLRVWDQGLIYLLIAGTYTPFTSYYLDGPLRAGLLTIIWSLAFFGFATKIWGQHRVNRLAVLNYILLGWLPALVLIPKIEPACFAWMAAGGVAYTLGTYFLKLDRARPYYHAIWHTFVMLGSACHFFAIVHFAIR